MVASCNNCCSLKNLKGHQKMIVPQQEAIIIVDNGNGPTKCHQKMY